MVAVLLQRLDQGRELVELQVVVAQVGYTENKDRHLLYTMGIQPRQVQLLHTER